MIPAIRSSNAAVDGGERAAAVSAAPKPAVQPGHSNADIFELRGGGGGHGGGGHVGGGGFHGGGTGFHGVGGGGFHGGHVGSYHGGYRGWGGGYRGGYGWGFRPWIWPVWYPSYWFRGSGSGW